MKIIFFDMDLSSAILVTAAILHSADGHGLLSFPASKNGGTLAITDESSTNHFALASYGIIDKAFFDGDHSITPWQRPGEFDWVLARDLIEGHPETLHPCGCNAGDVVNCAGVVQASGFGETTLGGSVTPPTWAMGSIQETAWNAWANHAGGHIYMLCKKTDFDSCRDTHLPNDPTFATREEKDAYLACVWNCFESNTLEWAPESQRNQWSQKLQFQNDPCTYATMEPETKVGKDGHLWRFTPIPDTLQVTNGGEGQCMWDSLISFSNSKAREEFVASFGEDDVCDWGDDSHTPYNWHVFDKIVVPTNLEEGEYLLSWRWDAYMADQMWSNCADVSIVASLPNDTSIISELEDGCPTQAPVAYPPTPSPQPVANPPTTASPTPPTPSPLTCPPGYRGLLPHNECKQYYRCQDGEVIGNIIDCPDGTLFDTGYQYCNWEDQVTCETPPTQPPTPPEGCYSNNFKDCNHPHFQSENDACHTIWLPNGGRDSCIPLWGSCTNRSNECCEPAVCYQDDGIGPYAQCIPPNHDSPAPSTSPSNADVSVSSILDPNSSISLIGASKKRGGNFIIDGTTKKLTIIKDDEANSDPGFVATPSWGQSIVKGIRVYAANNLQTADPKSYKLEGRNHKKDSWVVISEGRLSLSKKRNRPGSDINSSFEEGDTLLNYDEVSFSNNIVYSKYRVTFPTVRKPPYVKVHMAEVELPGILIS